MKKNISIFLVIAVMIVNLKISKTLDMGFLGYIIGAIVGFTIGKRVKE